MTDAEIIENGRWLFQSAQNVRRSNADLNALLESLEEIVEKGYFKQIERLEDEDTAYESDWISTGFAYNASVRMPRIPPQRKDRHIGSLTFIVRLCNLAEAENEPIDWPWLDQACLIVAWHRSQSDDDQWEIENFEPTDENVASIYHRGGGVWEWKPEPSDKYKAYFFAIPIFSLRNESDLKRYALAPLKALFYSEDPVTSARDVLKGVPAMQPSI